MNRMKSALAVLLSSSLIASAALGLTPGTSVDAAGHGISNPRVDKSHVVTWDCISFGNYWQEDTNGDKKADDTDEKTPIQWRVLSVKGDDALIMSEKSLSYQKYNESGTTWENCALRKWLNETFYNDAFSAAEQAAIQTTTVLHDNDPYRGTHGGNDTRDKVYLPSLKEVTTAEYGFDVTAINGSATRYAAVTAYAAATGKVITAGPTAPSSWWTRTPGRNTNYVRIILGGTASDAGAAGDAANQGGTVCYNRGGVRPVLHINLGASSVWKKSGTVQAKSKLAATGTATGSSGTKGSSETKTSGSTAKKTSSKKSAAKAPKVSYKLKTNKLTVKYTAPKNTAGFQVRYKLGKGKWKVKTYNTKKSVSKTIRGLKKGKYTVQVRSFKKGKKNYSKWSKAKTIKVSKAKKKAKKKVQLDLSEG